MPDPTWRVIAGDCRSSLASLPAGSVQTCVTSPPYFGLRDYGHEGQIGLEPTPDEFVAVLVDVFRAVRRVLRDDGTVWLNLGDSYAGSWGNQGRKAERGTQRAINGDMLTPVMDGRYPDAGRNTGAIPAGVDYKAKDLLGVPWMVAFALRADGWYLRSDIIWAKPNPMPESVTDRPTKAHEYLFLLSKSARYYYDADAIREPHENLTGGGRQRAALAGIRLDESQRGRPPVNGEQRGNYGLDNAAINPAGRNSRSVWTVATQPFPGAHFATFPPKLIEPCILAGSSPKACGVCGAPWRRVVKNHGPDKVKEHDRHTPGIAGRSDNGRQQGLAGVAMGARWERETVGWESSCEHDDDTGRGIVLDPFAGSGTVGVVCGWHGRDFIGLELSETYAEMARNRITAEGKPWRPRSEPPKVHADQLDILSALEPG
jgi:DNA modification methylase